MNPFEMVVAIVIVVTVGRVLQARFAAERNGVAQPDPALRSENQQLRRELDQLRDRVQVLERVITDNHTASDLDREIERLRNK